MQIYYPEKFVIMTVENGVTKLLSTQLSKLQVSLFVNYWNTQGYITALNNI